MSDAINIIRPAISREWRLDVSLGLRMDNAAHAAVVDLMRAGLIIREEDEMPLDDFPWKCAAGGCGAQRQTAHENKWLPDKRCEQDQRRYPIEVRG